MSNMFAKAALLSAVSLANARSTSSLAPLEALASSGVCDIYSDGGTPCVAAHSMTRALYASYNGPLYQVIRGSDQATQDIGLLSQGGVANAATQDSFCAGTTCLVNQIYDQSGNGNTLTRGVDGNGNGDDNLASAVGAPVTVNGNRAYALFIEPLTGYRVENGKGTATGNEPEGMYAVFDGTHFNDLCCFDYGNAETNNRDDGATTMEAMYLGSNSYWGSGAGNGPWLMGDLENGLFSGYGNKQNTNDPTITNRFFTAVLKGDSSNLWALRGGNAQSGSLSTFYSGQRPSGYYPMNKQGSIVLGTGGDNSNGAQGTFHEGVLVSGYPSDATENEVQANIVAANYQAASLASGPSYTVGNTVTFRVTTPGYTNRYIAHSGSTVNTQVITSSSSSSTQATGSWIVRSPLGGSPSCYSFESSDTPGSYLYFTNPGLQNSNDFQLMIAQPDGSQQFNEDATWCPQTGLNSDSNTSLRSWSYPTRYVRHYDDVGYAASNGNGPRSNYNFDNSNFYSNDVSFTPGSGFIN